MRMGECPRVCREKGELGEMPHEPVVATAVLAQQVKVSQRKPARLTAFVGLPVDNVSEPGRSNDAPPSLLLDLPTERPEQGLAALDVATDDVPTAGQKPPLPAAAVDEYPPSVIEDQRPNDACAAGGLGLRLERAEVGRQRRPKNQRSSGLSSSSRLNGRTRSLLPSCSSTLTSSSSVVFAASKASSSS
jgi:hypothetical protein